MEQGIKKFEPHGWLRNGHAQTIAGAFVRRTFLMPAGEERLFRVDAETQLKAVCHWRREEPQKSSNATEERTRDALGTTKGLPNGEWCRNGLQRGWTPTKNKAPASLPASGQALRSSAQAEGGRYKTETDDRRRDLPGIVIVHGLEGSCESNYSAGIADKAWARGFHAVRMNQRNCGGTERLTPTLYNSGMSGDYRAVLMELIEGGFEQIYFVGYSMGGNLVTKMAGELGDSAPKQLKGVAAVCPALDLSACADALERPFNFLYQRHFVKNLMMRYRRKADLFPERYAKNGFGLIRTVREFDDEITAPCFGFKDAEEYYEAASAKKVIAKVRVPLLVITAQDDPFVPYESFSRAGVTENPCVQFVAPEHGGHCGFISRFAGAERFWAEERVVEFVEKESGRVSK